MAENSKAIFNLHRGGKIEIIFKKPLRHRHDLAKIYTPGVAKVSQLIAKNPAAKKDYTIAGRTIAIVTDGSAVLGLGDIGPEAALPVMEGKAALFKRFAGLDAFPLCLATKKTDKIVAVVKAIAPVFAGINLEDIAAPRCFEIEDKLQNLGIPVMHDDQHGTAVVVLASLTNAAKVTGRKLKNLKVAIAGAGAAGIAISKLLTGRVRETILADSHGLICRRRKDLNGAKKNLLKITNRQNLCGNLADALKGADVFIGVSRPKLLTPKMIKLMSKNPIIFALANPVPEIMPKLAEKAGAAVVATGRSDFPNQINNALAFPGIFRGAIEAVAPKITPEMKLAAAQALANIVKNPTAKKIIPSVLDIKTHQIVSSAVAKAWRQNE